MCIRDSFNIMFYALNAKGEHGGASMYAGNYGFCDEKGPNTADNAFLLPGSEAH